MISAVTRYETNEKVPVSKWLSIVTKNGFQQKIKMLAVFVDLTRAFDKVWKEGLLFKRVCGNMYSWIQSYLFQRSA